MNIKDLQTKALNASKWTTITSIATRLITPITNMILARILAPEAFGILATITMIISFVDMFSDAGFQKYLIQHEFEDKDEMHKSANVAFWTNLIVSLCLWLIIIVFRHPIAAMVGNPGLGNVIIISCVQLPLTSFSSIQMALHQRKFEFKTIFIVRLFTIIVPFFVTIPLAFIGLGFWSLIIGVITQKLLEAVIITIRSDWKPKFFYSFNILREMLSFSMWSLIEAISIWFTVWIDSFIVGSFLNQHYLGLYKTSMSMVNSFMGVVNAATVPILFSALSRLQYENLRFNNAFFKVQRIVAVLIFPIGIGIFLYSDFVTRILFGSKWSEAGGIIGIYSLTNAIKVVFCNYSSEVYRAKGKPKLSFVAQLLHIGALVPTCLISLRYGFWSLVYARSLIQLQFVIVHLMIMKYAMNIKILETIMNVLLPAVLAIFMGIFGYSLKIIGDDILWSFISIILCILFYFVLILLFPTTRKEFLNLFKQLMPKGFLHRFKTLFNES